VSHGGTTGVEGDKILRPEMVLYEMDKFGPLTVCVVDDWMLRNRCYLDFCQGGNGQAYADWKGEMTPTTVILAASVPGEWEFIKLHEVREYCKMLHEGWPYPKAHLYANVGEKQARDAWREGNRDVLRRLLDEELRTLERDHGRASDMARKARKYG
jgi:hypothetical protein